MKKILLLLALAISLPVFAATPTTIVDKTSTYAATVDSGGALKVTGTVTPSGTGDVNIKQVNGATVNVGIGAASTGTQRVSTSSDSTIGVTNFPTTVSVNTGATGASSPRMTVATDTATIAGSAPGTAGSASANVVTMQGVASMTPVQVTGNIASGAANAGSPVKVACKYNLSPPTLTDGWGSDVNCDNLGNIKVRDIGTTSTSVTGVAQHVDATASNGNTGPWGAEMFLYNGASRDSGFTCPNNASVNVTAGNTTQIVALSGSTTIRICSVSLGISVTGTVAFTSGTGSNCGTPSQAMAAIPLTTGSVWAQSAPAGGSLYRGAASGEFCITAVTGNVTGWVTYAQY